MSNLPMQPYIQSAGIPWSLKPQPQDPILAEVQECFISAGFLDDRDQMEVAFCVLEGVARHCPDKVKITHVRARLFKASEQESIFPTWLKLEWRWKRDIDITAFFLLDNSPCSMTMFSGMGELRVAGRKWEKAQLTWTVADIEHLRILFCLVHRDKPIAKVYDNHKGPLDLS
jgi:hypothetical protein